MLNVMMFRRCLHVITSNILFYPLKIPLVLILKKKRTPQYKAIFDVFGAKNGFILRGPL
jgi:hypothetical protein